MNWKRLALQAALTVLAATVTFAADHVTDAGLDPATASFLTGLLVTAGHYLHDYLSTPPSPPPAAPIGFQTPNLTPA